MRQISWSQTRYVNRKHAATWESAIERFQMSGLEPASGGACENQIGLNGVKMVTEYFSNEKHDPADREDIIAPIRDCGMCDSETGALFQCAADACRTW